MARVPIFAAVRRAAVTLLPVLLLAVAGCGSQPRSAALSPQEVKRQLAGSPPALAALHRQAGHLVSGDFDAQLRALRGRPVVVNKWASWCPPCRFEFPFFQRAAVKYGRQVAFVGLDSNDVNGDAQKFLKRYPVPYPSFVDPHDKSAGDLGAAGAWPTTIYIDRRGKVFYVKQGGYQKEADLETDIRRYALGHG